MNNAHERHNAKARQSTAGRRKKGKRKAPYTMIKEPKHDPNSDIIVPKSEEQKELDRRERLKQELLSQSESKGNSKKKKRLEKYIDKKLKQEERIALFEKLSKSQAQLSTALQLHSSATLGTGKVATHRERLEREEHNEVRRAVGGTSGRNKRKRMSNVYHGAASESSEDDLDITSETTGSIAAVPDRELGKSRATPVVIVDSGFSTAQQNSEPVPTANVSYIGSALKKTPGGSVVPPRIVKKSCSKITFSTWKEAPQRKIVAAEDSDTSFDSSDSAEDSDSDSNEERFEADSDAENDDSEVEIGGEQTSTAERPVSPPKKQLGFKDWALKQLSAAKEYVAPPTTQGSEPLLPVTTEHTTPPPAKKRKIEATPGEMRGPLGKDLVLPATSFTKYLQESAQNPSQSSRRKVVEVRRPAAVEEARLLLPIVAEEQPIMEAILLNSVVIICGETGSGKTTQVPQFLYEAGFGSLGSDNPGMIGVTQPRRVAAMSMASRVAQELSLTSSKVSYQIRYDATVSPDTSIKFMTDGVLLRELATDFLLTKYSAIIIDEAHERSMNTDILIGVLSRVIKLREEMWTQKKDGVKPLRLIVMSATLRVSDFAENTTLFPTPPPIITVSARQHPVTVHFSRRTVSDYVSEAIRKTSKIHARLPPGGILIFLTGQNEISGACKKLEARYGAKALADKKKRRSTIANVARFAAGQAQETKLGVVPSQADVEAEDMDLGAEQMDLALDVDGDNADGDMDEEALDSDNNLEDEELGINTEESEVPMHIVPLYALLPNEKQMQVFKPPPEGHRLVVVSTNVAETSLTIPGIRYVVDCGRAKERRYDHQNGVQTFQISWISKASAAQRAGRAGRTGPGHCYRLYSSALFETYFEQFSQPEILRTPIEGVVLQMKSMHIDAVVNFPFPTPPDRLSLKKAETVLTHLGALTAPPNGAAAGEITDVGRAMSLFPLSPRFSRMLVSGRQHGCLPYVISIVSALSVGDPFLREEALDQEDESSGEDSDEGLSHIRSEAVRVKEARRLRRKVFFESQELHASLGDHASDIFRILSVVGAYEYAGGGHQFCADHFVRPKAMEEIHKLRSQISSIVQINFPETDSGFVANIQPPSKLQLKVLRQLITAGFIDQVAVRKDKVEKGTASGDQFTTSRGVPYRAVGIDEDVFIHPTSVLANSPPPEFIVFLEVVRTSKAWIKGLTVVNPGWLSQLGRSLCTFSKPVKTKDGTSVVIPHFGPGGWELPPVKDSP
ncbi:hypothetical protein PHLGIDRAFT_29519 [Phlebiopsis gigantea 11061_1 CR5-6]|uniref:RNA helicase n=1 Tax=Phlebiopsis gigantea (strain 11061_1 CR5-6) TaxID=745531 RepID=A0A0C3PNW6_PHLG1|nr:hypothetical protein PHLGIDRAFT_29519 [Phlebiopsis gigantea 11061_1 CR5-6]